MKLAAEVDQAVGRLHLHPQLRHLAQDPPQLLDDADSAFLQPLDGLWRGGVDLDVGAVDPVPRLLQLLLHAHEIIAQLAGAAELLLQRLQQRVGFAQRKETGGERDVHGRTLQNARAPGKTDRMVACVGCCAI